MGGLFCAFKRPFCRDKSVVYDMCIKEYILKGYNVSYVTKNKTPRESYIKLLSETDIKQLLILPFYWRKRMLPF